MKVYIGPYRYTWTSNIHTKYMNKKYGYNKWEDSHNTWERALEKLELGLQNVYNATINKLLNKRARSQKVKIRIDDYDIWGMDDTLALVIAPMLALLKQKKHGSAWVEDQDVPEHLCDQQAVTHQDHADHDRLIQERWSWVLDEMIWAFEQKTRPEGWEHDYYDFKTPHSQSSDVGWSRIDHEGLKKHQQRMSNGFRLFGKYFEALWD